MDNKNKRSRRDFLRSLADPDTARAITDTRPGAANGPASPAGRRGRNRVGAVAYGYQYSIGLFSYQDRPGEKFDAVKFVEANHAAGGEVAQLFHSMIRDLIKRINSPNVGVIFDVGNTIGTLDDPTEAADILGPCTVATHYKDFAIEEVARGFRFCMVPLGCGSLQLPEITARLLKHVDPESGS